MYELTRPGILLKLVLRPQEHNQIAIGLIICEALLGTRPPVLQSTFTISWVLKDEFHHGSSGTFLRGSAVARFFEKFSREASDELKADLKVIEEQRLLAGTASTESLKTYASRRARTAGAGLPKIDDDELWVCDTEELQANEHENIVSGQKDAGGSRTSNSSLTDITLKAAIPSKLLTAPTYGSSRPNTMKRYVIY